MVEISLTKRCLNIMLRLSKTIGRQFNHYWEPLIGGRSLTQLLNDYQRYLVMGVSAILLITFFNSNNGVDAFYLSAIYLFFAYLFFIGLLLSYFEIKQIATILKPSALTKRLTSWLYNQRNLISVNIVICLMLILDNISQYRFFYNLTLVLAYALLFFHIVVLVQQRLKTTPLNINQQDKKNYLIYAVILVVIFLFSPTMDQSDPYGPHFQLRVVFWLLIAHLVIYWILGQWKLIKQLENERTNAELMHLKSQVNPHFLFNTLNNLYGLAREKSDETPELILKLSDMLRYTIYQGKKDRVKLTEEINYLKDFIQLQQVRYHKVVNIEFNHHLENDDYSISPLLLIILLENAYKHGVEKLTIDAFVKVDLEIIKGSLIFIIENNYDEDETSGTLGIGLENLRRRLNLIYPGSHKLEINDINHLYTVRLEIDLNKNE